MSWVVTLQYGKIFLLSVEVLNAVRTEVNWYEYQTCSN